MGFREAAALAAPQSRETRPIRHRIRALRHGRGDALRDPRSEEAPRSVCAMGHKWMWRDAMPVVRVFGRPSIHCCEDVEASGTLRDFGQNRGSSVVRSGREARTARGDSDSGGRFRRALGRGRRWRAARRRGERGGHLHLHHRDRRKARADSRSVRRGRRFRVSESHRNRSRDFRPPATFSIRSRNAPAPPSRSFRAAWRIIARAKPVCCGSPGTTAIERCW